MQYTYTSIKDAVGMLIRNTRLQDSSYISNAHEWIFEALKLMSTEYVTQGKWIDITISFHKGKLPCELDSVDAVEWENRRLREYKPVRPPQLHKFAEPAGAIGVFESEVVKLESLTDRYTYESLLKSVNSKSQHPNAYYYTEMGYINTSFEEGTVTVYYQALPVDNDGMPMIPDNQNFKNALYWYCRAMMIGSGWKDEQFNFEYCMKQFEEVYAPRAIAEIRMPGADQMERRVDLFTRFIPAAGYYDSFFHVDRPESYINLHGS